MEIKLNIEPLKLNGTIFNRPIIISGPCSAESEEQVMSTARALKELNIPIFRAGIWKPRTRPDAFEGIGSKGLSWLKRVKEELGMYTATEVANVKHVYEALKYGIDILWIGARTTSNPFAVQEIADTLKGVDIPVLIKNPVSPDLDLWIGAIERIHNAGITKIVAIHRGFYNYSQEIFRNEPYWQIPIELKRRIPGIQVITDPSHICGNREFIHKISQKAMDLFFDGLIIESHINPEVAISDAKQQLTPADLKILLDNLIIRKQDIEDDQLMHSLEGLRKQIDKYDNEILSVFGKRMQLADKIGEYKKTNNITILQSSRWNEIIENSIKKGAELGLSEEFITKVFKAIHQESINHQTLIMNPNGKKTIDEKMD